VGFKFHQDWGTWLAVTFKGTVIRVKGELRKFLDKVGFVFSAEFCYVGEFEAYTADLVDL
jgi:hypothetical protein